MRVLPLLLVFGCTGTDDKSGDDTGGELEPVCTDPVAPECVDAMILDLSLHDDKTSRGDVTTVTEGSDFVTAIDASAGGYSQAANNAWVYIRFGADGAEKLEIDDETALEDMTWHLALRRFIVRLNSGDSGPSCVGAAAMIGSTYEEVTSVPDGLTYLHDDYYTDDCTIINDSSGLPGSPQVAMGAWWSYEACVQTTGTPFIVQLEDGRTIKLVVETYYADDGQDECNETGSTTAESGYYSIRWAEL